MTQKKTLKNSENGWLRVKMLIQGRCGPRPHQNLIFLTSELDSPHRNTLSGNHSANFNYNLQAVIDSPKPLINYPDPLIPPKVLQTDQPMDRQTIF